MRFSPLPLASLGEGEKRMNDPSRKVESASAVGEDCIDSFSQTWERVGVRASYTLPYAAIRSAGASSRSTGASSSAFSWKRATTSSRREAIALSSVAASLTCSTVTV